MKRLFTLIVTTLAVVLLLVAAPEKRALLPQSPTSTAADYKIKKRAKAGTALLEDRTGALLKRPASVTHKARTKRASAPARLTSKGDLLYGYLAWSDADDFDPGLYSFQPEGYELVWADQDYYDYSDEIFSTCWYADGRVKGYKLLIYGGTPFYYAYLEIDMATGEVLVNEEIDVDGPVQSFMQHDACYDADNDVIYGFGYVQQSNGAYRYGLAKVLGTDPLSATLIRPLDEDLDDTPRSMCFNSDDKMLYAIDESLRFLRINPADGELEEVCTLEFDNDAKYISGLAYHPIRKTYYWNPCSSDGSAAMADIDPVTGKVNVYEHFELGEEFIALFTTEEKPAPLRPDRPVFKSFDFTDGSTSGSVTFTMPEKTGNGEAITQTMNWNCLLDGETSKTGTAAAGEDVTIQFSGLSDDMHLFTFNATLGNEQSRSANYRAYIGNDTPLMPQNVVLTHTEITWDEVTAGIHGGYIDTDKMMYKVYLNDELIATTAETSVEIEIPADGELTGYKATVLAECNGLTSNPALSNGIVSGDPLALPVYLVPSEDDFSKMTQYYEYLSDEAELWTWEEGDEYSDACIASGWTVDEDTEMDSWLFMPPVKIDDASKIYSLSFDSRLRSSMYPEEYIEIVLCSAPDPESAVSTIMESFTPAKYSYSHYSVLFEAPQPGTYYIGFHCAAAPEQFGSKFNHISIEDKNITANSPAAATDLSATAAADGVLKATVSFKMPLTTFTGLDYEGEPLPADATLTATVSAATVATVTGKPGETVTAEIGTVQGNNTVTVIVANAEGLTSEPATTEVYTGVVAPASVRNLKVQESDDMLKVTLSWDAPDKGVNDGYIIPENIRYTVYQIVDGSFNTLAEGITQKEFTAGIPAGTPQAAYNFGVTATNAAGSNGYYVSATAILGTPLELPIIENFDDQQKPYASSPWLVSKPTAAYTASLGWTMLKNYDSEKYGDSTTGGLIAVGKTAGAKGRLCTPRFTTAGLESATLEAEAIDFDNAGKIVFLAKTTSDELVEIGRIEPTFTGAVKKYTFDFPNTLLGKSWAGIFIDFEFDKPGTCFIESLKIEGKQSGLGSIAGETVSIAAGKGCITIKGFEGHISIAATDGRIVASRDIEGDTSIELASGIYVVKADSKIAKVIVR